MRKMQPDRRRKVSDAPKRPKEEKRLNRYRKVLKYKKRVKGGTLEELGLDSKNLSPSQLEQLYDILGDKEIEIRTDPLFGEYSLHTTLISEERAKRPGAAKPVEKEYSEEDIKEIASILYIERVNIDDAINLYKERLSENEKKDCIFCKPNIDSKTPFPKMYYGEQKIVTIPNLYPYTVSHFVTVFTNEHKTDLEELTEEDIAVNLRTGIELAFELKKYGCDGMWDFINWGARAGASQKHAHSQRGELNRFMAPSLMDKESEALKKRILKWGSDRDPFEFYMKLARNKLLIYEDDYIFVFAPHAPRLTDQVDILTKKNGKIVSNYLELKDEDKMIESVSKGMIHVLRKLKTKRGIENLNIETHQARFNGSEDYRMHWHIYPRTNLIAGMELNDVYIVSAYPEDTAKALR